MGFLSDTIEITSQRSEIDGAGHYIILFNSHSISGDRKEVVTELNKALPGIAISYIVVSTVIRSYRNIITTSHNGQRRENGYHEKPPIR